MIHAKNGGRRQALRKRFDLIPHEGLASEAEIFHEGAEKYDEDNWKGLDFRGSETAPINHAFDHLSKAASLPFGSAERRRQLAKVAANAHMQIWGEANEPQTVWEKIKNWCSPKDSVGDQADGFAFDRVGQCIPHIGPDSPGWVDLRDPGPQDADDPGEPEPSVLDYEETQEKSIVPQGLRSLFAANHSTNSSEPSSEAATGTDQLDR